MTTRLQPAIALLEFESIAVGMRAGDAMVKRAAVEVTYAGTVHPGKYLVLVGGDVAVVEEAYSAGRQAGGDSLIDSIFLPSAHQDLVAILRGSQGRMSGDAVGVVETRTAASTVGAVDRGRKGAEVEIVEIRLADRLGGKAFCIFSGLISDVEAAVDLAAGPIEKTGFLIARVVIPQFHSEMLANLESSSDFARNLMGGH